MNRNRRKGVFTIEYAVMIVFFMAAFIAMFGYIRGAVCAKMRSSADAIGGGRQYQR